MEPIRTVLRRINMIAKFSLLFVALMMLTTTAFAQNNEPLDVELSAGIDGYVASDAPGVVLIEVSSPVLFVGSVETRVGNHRNQVAVEIPADGRKTIEVPFPAPGAQATAQVFFYDVDGEEIQKASLSLQAPIDALVVGVVSSPETERTLSAVRSTPVGLPIEPVSVAMDQLDERLAALPYLVIAPDAASQLTSEQRAQLDVWMDDGGRLIMEEDSFGSLVIGDLTALGPARIGPMGSGETIIIDLAAIDEAGWATVLRDVPRPASAFATFNGGEMNVSFGLFEAASSQSDASLPELSWLLTGLLTYVALVGPINMLVLRRLNKTHLTWVTVPLVSLLTVSLFWWGGPKSEDDSTIVHSSVVYYDETASRATSGIVLIAGTEGNYRMVMPEGWSAFPSEVGMFGEQRRQVATTDFVDGAVGIEFDLPNLGTGAISADWVPETPPVTAEWAVDDDALTIVFSNETDLDFWAWGIVRGGRGERGAGSLVPNDSGTISMPTNPLGGGDRFETPIVDAFFQGGGFFDGEQDRVLWPLTNVAQSMGILSDSDTYFWAFSEDYALDLELDGADRMATGPALVIVNINVPGSVGDQGEASGEILSIDGADYVENGGAQVYIGGADSVYLSYTIPEGVKEVDIVDNWGGGQPQSEYQLYNWAESAFETLDSLFGVEVSSYRSPSGEVVLAVLPGNFSDIVPNYLTMRWSR